MGGIPLNKITIPAETAFQHQCTPAVPEGTVADFQLFPYDSPMCQQIGDGRANNPQDVDGVGWDPTAGRLLCGYVAMWLCGSVAM